MSAREFDSLRPLGHNEFVRPSPRLVSAVLLALSGVVGNYFAMGDTRVFQTIRFDFRTPIRADQAIIGFVKHLEGQRTVAWGSWDPIPGQIGLAQGDEALGMAGGA